MKKILLFAIINITAILNIEAQQSHSKLKLTGFDITIVTSDAFSLDYDKSVQVFRTTQSDVLVLRTQNQKKKTKIKISAKNIQQLELDDCSLVYDKAKGEELSINATSYSKVSITNAELNTLSVNIEGGANLEVGGKITNTNCVVKGASSMQAIGLTTDILKLNASAASKVNISSVTAKEIEVIAKYASEVTIQGSADLLNINANMAVKIDATKLVAQSAKVFSSRGCVIDINAKELETNEYVKNVADEGKPQNLEDTTFEDLFKQ